MHTVKGVGCLRFQLEFGELLEVSKVLYVPRLRENRLSIPALEDEGYTIMLKKGHIFIYPVGVDPFDPVLIGHQRDSKYVMRGKPTSGRSGWITCSKSETNKERDDPRINVASNSHSLVQRGERISKD